MRLKYIPSLMVLFTCPLAFDFRSSDEIQGHFIQYLMVAPVLLCGPLLAISVQRFRSNCQLRRLMTVTMILTLIGSVFPNFMEGNIFENYLRVLLSYILFAIGYAVGCQPWTDTRLQTLERFFYISCVFSLFASFFYGVFGGEAIEDVRYRILSPVILGFQGLLLYDVAVCGRWKKIGIVLFSATVVIELISVTRSLLVGTVLLFIFVSWLNTPKLAYLLRSLIRMGGGACLFAAVIGFSASFTFPSVIDHWYQRIFYATTTESGRDPTTLSRLAEMEDQYDQVTSSFANVLIGKGYGHQYFYSENYIMQMLEFSTINDLKSISSWSAGHNFWVYQFFAGGILFGIAFPVVMVYVVFMSFKLYRRLRGIGIRDKRLDSLGRYAMVMVGMLVSTVGGNPLGPRYGGLIYGLALGLSISAYSCLKMKYFMHR